MAPSSWKSEKFGISALSICLVELFGIWAPVLYALRHPSSDWRWLERPLGFLYVAGVFSIGIAIVGLFRDRRRLIAFISLLFGVVNFVLCMMPLAR